MNIKTLSAAIKKGGFTYSLSLGNLANEPFWAVGLNKNTEKVFDSPPTTADIEAYILSNRGELFSASYDRVLGGWEHKGKYYLDVSVVIRKDNPLNTLEGVLTYAKANDQIAIFDLESMTEIIVEP